MRLRPRLSSVKLTPATDTTEPARIEILLLTKLFILPEVIPPLTRVTDGLNAAAFTAPVAENVKALLSILTLPFSSRSL